ncbi:hypothetical protein ACMFMF_001241 [Clarireedia jacksonii]
MWNRSNAQWFRLLLNDGQDRDSLSLKFRLDLQSHDDTARLNQLTSRLFLLSISTPGYSRRTSLLLQFDYRICFALDRNKKLFFKTVHQIVMQCLYDLGFYTLQ